MAPLVTGSPHERSIFFHSENFLLREDGSTAKLNLPTDAGVEIDKDQIFVTLKSDWQVGATSYKVGTLLRLGVEDVVKGASAAEVVFAPTKTQFLQEQHYHKGRVFLALSDDVTSKVVEVVRRQGQSGAEWQQTKIQLPENSSIHMMGYSRRNEILIFSSENFLNSKTIFNFDLKAKTVKQIDQAPSYFDASPFSVKQNFTESKDGTRVPYYVIYKKGIKFDGRNPTVITAYGGFEISETPYYSGVIGNAWLNNGGVWIVANIRGGGEYGPAWHTAALKEHRQRAFDDFFAVAEDVNRKKISSPAHMGAVGGSNGGLLMGVALTQRPDLYNAIAIQVPLLDMLRFNKLLAGASWMGEYGNPDDPNDRKYIEAYSLYQNVKAGMKYPEVFFMTSTADDRVHPGHARRTAAKMESLGYPFYYYENTEGGHGGSANNAQRAKWSALEFVYFWQKLK